MPTAMAIHTCRKRKEKTADFDPNTTRKVMGAASVPAESFRAASHPSRRPASRVTTRVQAPV